MPARDRYKIHHGYREATKHGPHDHPLGVVHTYNYAKVNYEMSYLI